jgi:hypothetical protein
MKSDYIRLLERLEREFTPGGSEFAHDETTIIGFIKERITRAEADVIKRCIQANELRAELNTLRKPAMVRANENAKQ